MNPIFSGIYSKSLSRFCSGMSEMQSLLVERNGESRFYGGFLGRRKFFEMAIAIPLHYSPATSCL
ncbi:hypothetical protein J3R74_001543 [Puniceicoccus vermicola]